MATLREWDSLHAAPLQLHSSLFLEMGKHRQSHCSAAIHQVCSLSQDWDHKLAGTLISFTHSHTEDRRQMAWLIDFCSSIQRNPCVFWRCLSRGRLVLTMKMHWSLLKIVTHSHSRAGVSMVAEPPNRLFTQCNSHMKSCCSIRWKTAGTIINATAACWWRQKALPVLHLGATMTTSPCDQSDNTTFYTRHYLLTMATNVIHRFHSYKHNVFLSFLSPLAFQSHIVSFNLYLVDELFCGSISWWPALKKQKAFIRSLTFGSLPSFSVQVLASLLSDAMKPNRSLWVEIVTQYWSSSVARLRCLVGFGTQRITDVWVDLQQSTLTSTFWVVC